jgi:23S rRNA (uracil1939-C5)-methyltransferase/tRNA (uracil-5-)-methyltransferase
VAKKRFNAQPFAYHQEIELEIATLTNFGVGLGRVQLADSSLVLGTCDLELPAANAGAAWVLMVPFALPGERVRARIFRNHKNYSEADLVAVLAPSPHRVAFPRCALFGRCGGCQYQHLTYTEQLRWKQRQVAELLLHLAGIEFAVDPVVPSPREFGYRSKITPHFSAPRRVIENPNAKFQISKEIQDLSATGQPAAPTQDSEPRTQNSEPRTQNSEPRTRNPELRAPNAGAATDFPIGFLKQGSRHEIIDVPRCEIATDPINARLAAVREEVRSRVLAGEFERGATLLLREAAEGVTTDYGAVITEEITVAGLAEAGFPESPTPAAVEGFPEAQTPAVTGAPIPSSAARPPLAAPLRLRFLARDFFQNNPFILPEFAGYVREQAAAGGAHFLIDAYCGSGLFALAAADRFTRVAGIEVSETSVTFARENAAANGIANASFLAGDAAAIFAGVDFPPADTAVVIDPPRKGCDESFLRQLFSFGPRTVVYVSCDPATQMRDLKQFLASGYELTAVQPFDLFPQTRHLECVITLRKSG